jgi:hypothetical protein
MFFHSKTLQNTQKPELWPKTYMFLSQVLYNYSKQDILVVIIYYNPV